MIFNKHTTYFFLGIMLTHSCIYAFTEGIVKTYHAPLFNKESADSTIIQYLKRGQRVWIHGKHFKHYNETFTKDLLPADDSEEEGFYQTIDRGGQTAYIPKKYVKVIFNDTRELDSPKYLTPQEDPTDLRLKEPLPENYPFYTQKKTRLSLDLKVGKHPQYHYAYKQSLSKEDYDFPIAYEIYYLKRAEFDRENRFFFGLNIYALTLKSKYFADDIYATENNGIFGLGPAISYDFYRVADWILNWDGGIFLNLNKNNIKIKELSSSRTENRSFSSYSFSTRIGFNIIYRDIFPSFSLKLGTDMLVNLPHTMKSTANENQYLWNEDSIGVPFNIYPSVRIGLIGTF